MNYKGLALNFAGHADRGRDANGADIYVTTNGNDLTPVCESGIIKKVLPHGGETCMMTHSWALAVHVSCNNWSQGWCLVSTYSSKLNPDTNWPVYAGELLKVNLDGSGVTRLAHHRSSAASYQAMPRAAVSGNGRYVMFDSDMGGKIDTYVLDLESGTPAPVPAPTPSP